LAVVLLLSTNRTQDSYAARGVDTDRVQLNLWRDRAFLTYWSASAIDSLGTQVTFVAMPLVAVVVLQATAADTGILRAVVALPNLLFGLLAGALVDRLPRRRVLMASNLATAVLLASIPLAALAHELVLAQVFAVSFLAGTAGVFAGLAATAYLPALVGRDSLVDANSKLATTSSTLSIVGPSLAGVLVQTLTAPIAVAADAVLTAVAAVGFAAVRRAEPQTDPMRRHLLKEVVEGVAVVIGNRILRVLVLVVASFNLFSGVAQAVLVIYMARGLRLPPATIGLVFAASGPGALVGSVLSRRAADAAGIGPAIVVGGLTFGVGWTVPPLVFGPLPAVVAGLMASQFLLNAGAQLANVTIRSLRQAVIPGPLQGRANGTMLVLWQGVVPAGALAGGLIGQAAGPRTALAVAAAGSLGMMGALMMTRLARVRSLADVEPAVST